MTEFEKMTSGNLYNPYDEDLTKILKRTHDLVIKFNNTLYSEERERVKLLNKICPSTKDKNIEIYNPVYFEYGINTHFGNDVFCNYGCNFMDCANITINDHVMLGAEVMFATPKHPIHADNRRVQEFPDGLHNIEYALPIVVKENTWIASRVTVVGGVTIGKNCVIGAGAVVTKDIPDNSFAAGVPAKIIKKIDDSHKVDIWDMYMSEKMLS